jgi:outer membrane protein assembly factor BamB
MKRVPRAGVSIFLAFLVPVAAARADDWPQFLGPGRNGVSGEKGLLASWPKAGPTAVWQRDVGEGYSGPVIAGDRLILFHRVGDEDVVECLHAGTGKPQWRFAYPTDYADPLGKGDGPRSTPTVAGGKVITLGAQGMLHCLDLEKGTKLWEHALLKDYKVPPSYFGVGTSPVVEGDRVLVNVGGKGAGIVAFALADGKPLWKATDDGPSYSSPVLATAGQRRMAVFFTRFGVDLLDAKTGEVRYRQRWRAPIDASVNAATPLVIGDELFFSACYQTGALLLKLRADGSAEEVWHGEDVMDNHYNTAVYHDGHLYGFHGRQEYGPDFRCVDLKTKKVAWEKKRYGCGAMVLADGRLLVLTESGDLALVEATPQAYRELSRARVFEAGPCRSQPALAGGKFYARDQKKLVCFDLTK